jgi:RimJ/RimL family protein N-acetyltransferase
VDFVRGAARSRDGRSIIALRSTAKQGQVSRIRAALEEGAGVVTSRGDVRYIVTEYGIADLWGKSVRERARALIDIAHPDFRAQLLAEAKERRFVFADQKACLAVYPWQEERSVVLRDGSKVFVRPVRMTDEEALQRLFYELSSDSSYRRFMSHKSAHPHEEMQQLVDSNYDSNMALVVCDPESGELVGMARYDVDPSTRLADIAFVVRDDWQRRGIGTLLIRRMAEIARARGLLGFTANVLASNKPMLLVFQHSGFAVRSHFDGSTYDLELSFTEPRRSVPSPAHTTSQ